jgi:hypothetical protein
VTSCSEQKSEGDLLVVDWQGKSSARTREKSHNSSMSITRATVCLSLMVLSDVLTPSIPSTFFLSTSLPVF